MVKMQFNSNISPRTYGAILLFIVCMLCIFLGITILDARKTKDYVKVDAVVTGMEYRMSKPTKNNPDYYVNFNFEYKGKTYMNKQRVFFKSSKKEGKSIKVYINPDNPNEIRDTYKRNTNYMCIGIFLIFLLITIKAYKVSKA